MFVTALSFQFLENLIIIPATLRTASQLQSMGVGALWSREAQLQKEMWKNKKSFHTAFIRYQCRHDKERDLIKIKTCAECRMDDLSFTKQKLMDSHLRWQWPPQWNITGSQFVHHKTSHGWYIEPLLSSANWNMKGCDTMFFRANETWGYTRREPQVQICLPTSVCLCWMLTQDVEA